MDVLRRLGAERADERRLQLCIRAMVGAADDVCDLEVEIVDSRGELVGRRAVRTQQRRLAEAKRTFRVRLADQVRRLAVAHEALALAHRAFVPADPEPVEIADDRLPAARDVALGVCVVDPEQERPVVLVGESPVRDRAQRTAEMQRTRWAGRKAHARHKRRRYATKTTRQCPGSLLVLNRLVRR